MKLNSLAARLSLAFILVVVLGIATVSLLVRSEATQGFEGYLQARGGMYLARIAESLADDYRADGGWGDAQALLRGMARSSEDRLVLADSSGRIVADTTGQLLGRGVDSLGANATNRTSVVVDGNTVGTLYLISFTQGGGFQGRGRGGMGAGVKDRPGTGGASMGLPAATLEASYLASVDRAIWVAAILSGLFAIGVGLLMARQITRPLGELSAAAREVAAGKLAHRVKVQASGELGEVARAFNTMTASLEENEQARRRMVADIAHDLRTPLTVIEGTVDAMIDGVFQPDQANLESIKEEVALLTKLVADLRTLSLAEAGQLKLDREPTDLLELARRTVARIEPIAQHKGVLCHVEGSGELPEVDVDPDRMGQLLGNLLDNALRHTPAGGAITVKVCRGGPVCPPSTPPGRVILSVADTGEGIPPESLPLLFDRFYRVDEARTRGRGGSGLGLAIVKQLVEVHGGRVYAESEPGKGSRFVVELPVGQV